ncbi:MULTISPECIES: Sua5/YciO/YrdC/YwlC family protein [Campylobacter]|uniref:Sua5/YciO/YrdC/YwlC family protein n=1 Tax=Campylobacter TaxID=194 RepID=UPI000A34D1D8|nr:MULTISPECIES: Sua5/YciO/YrdC/YwlC family protein [unclassified Campylobacter]MCR8679488.1 Sua5 YciO YrdC YwlC family protein [Campylobacter sp. RM19072]
MIYLAQTDTTAGFLSQDLEKLNRVKNRPLNQPCLICVSQFSILKNISRVPKKYRNLVRRSKKTTFIYPNSQAIRVVKDHPHARLLDKLEWAYSTSANPHKKAFNIEFAVANADIIIDTKFTPAPASKIYKISKTNIKKIR